MSPIGYIIGLIWWGGIAFYVESSAVKIACAVAAVLMTVSFLRSRNRTVATQDAEVEEVGDSPDGLR